MRRGGRMSWASVLAGLAALLLTRGPPHAVAEEFLHSGPASPAEVAHSLAPAPRMRLAEQRSSSVHRKSATVEARRADLSGTASKTTFTLDLSAGVAAEVFTLANPYRVVVDLPDVTFRLPDGTGQKGEGLVTAFRYGLLAVGKARIVLDTKKPG